MYSFHLTLFADMTEIYDLWLPEVAEGFFRISENPAYRFIHFVGKEGQWRAVCNTPAFFRNVSMEQSYEIALTDEQLIEIDYDDKNFALYVEKVSSDKMKFHNYSVCSEVEICIGNRIGNDIYYDNPYVSEKHAVLKRTCGQWEIQDSRSTYGTYVNGKRIQYAKLKLGDVIFIMGLKIIVGVKFISVNDCSGAVLVNPHIIQDDVVSRSGYLHYYGQEIGTSKDEFFNRSPRKRFEMPEKIITVEGPPMSMDQKQIPLMLRMGSSMVMGGTAALAGNFTSLLSSVLFPVLNSKYTDKQRQEYEELRYTKYTEYLELKREEIIGACREERQFLNQKYPKVSEMMVDSRKKQHLWERRPVDTDFLQIRLGTGSLPLSAVIDYPVKRFQLDSDELEEKMYRLVEGEHIVEGVPVVLSLADTTVCGLLGSRDRVIEYIRQLVLQIAVFHSYDEVKMVFLMDQKELNCLDDIRYLPHVWDDQKTMRFIATSEAEAYSLGEYIKSQVNENQDSEKNLKQILKKRPYYIIFALDKKLYDSHEVLKEILQFEENRGVSVVTAYDELPKESQKIITLEASEKGICTTMAENGGRDVSFVEECCSQKEISKTMRMLANVRLKTATQTQEMPKKVTFLEMYKTGSIEQLNPLKRWTENNPVVSLAAPVGVGADGSLFSLDLHEKRQGPHGLVAGMTGSGKSEFIITYILSMAVNYHPDEVAFVLIDYKGGGLAGAFENPQTGVRLPHLVGTITNLDGASIQRSLMSIESELIRRQKIFHEVKSTVNEGTMDIYAYQKLYRAGKVTEPMPHLFIISDEFAELKQQQPEFMAKLVSAARIGRSLGVHLILATQKPSGVVDDQIRSNTKFRVCLRVQDRSDSMDMLKRPEAAELTDTGRFYLQVGYNEYFAMGQYAWCGASYEPQATVTVQKDETIEFLDISGQVIAKAKPKVKKVDSGKKQIVAIVEYLSELAKTTNINSKPLWLPELSEKLDLETLQQEHARLLQNNMAVCLGMIDDPEKQRQMPMILDLKRCQNILVAGEGKSGKTTILQNILFTLTKRLSEREFHFYILDCSSRMMKIYKPLPHCGAVLYDEDASSYDAFFTVINEIIADRKKLFSEMEVDTFDAALEVRCIPLILVAIDGFAIFAGTKKGESFVYQLPGVLKDCANYGVKFLLTCARPNEINNRIRQMVGERICLHMMDKYDYTDVLGTKVSYYPPDNPGRGVVCVNGRPLEFQAAIYASHLNGKKRMQYLKNGIDVLIKNGDLHYVARRLPVIDENAEYVEFAGQFKAGRIPLGYAQATGKPVSLPLKQFSVLSVYIGNPQGIKPIIKNLLFAACREQMDCWIIKKNNNSVFDAGEEMVDTKHLEKTDYLSCSTQDIQFLQKALMSAMGQRKQILDRIWNEQGINPDCKDAIQLAMPTLMAETTPILLLIESMKDFLAAQNSILTFSYKTMFEKAAQRNIYVIVCCEPGLSQQSAESILFNCFCERDVLLFGGQLDQQKLCPSFTDSTVAKLLPYNKAVMKYKNQFHPLVMPCGLLENVVKDEDMESIF